MSDLADDLEYDVFLSYKTRKYLPLASATYARLTAAGYRVWFDRLVLDRKLTTGADYEKTELISLLSHAARSARCAVVFEAEMEAVLLPLGMTREYAVTNFLAHGDEYGGLINWNWQKVEIDASRRVVAIYPTSHRVTAHGSGGENVMNVGFHTEEELFTALLTCVGALLH